MDLKYCFTATFKPINVYCLSFSISFQWLGLYIALLTLLHALVLLLIHLIKVVCLNVNLTHMC